MLAELSDLAKTTEPVRSGNGSRTNFTKKSINTETSYHHLNDCFECTPA